MARKLQVGCPTDGPVMVRSFGVVLDDEEGVYRFTCPACGDIVAKAMTQGIRMLLRGAGVASIDELVESGAALLEDDRNIWRAML